MALLAGRDHVGPAEVRSGIRNLQNVVRSMAIVALGGLGVSELRDLPMISIKVCLRDRFMALAALSHDSELEAFIVRAGNCVRAVAVVADRKRIFGLSDVAGVDTVFELILNPVMTLPACGRDVLHVHA